MTDFTMDYYLLVQATKIEGMNMETYGVRLVQTYSDGRVETLSLYNITPHRSKMEKLIEMMKRGMVTIMTAEEIVEDFLEM